MGLGETVPGGFPDAKAETPMVADLVADMPKNMSLCLGINPHSLNVHSLAETEDLIKNSKKVVGMKIYAGYYHVDITDAVYDPIYKLAEKHDLTIVVHTGETYSDRGLLKYAHPLRVDDLAVSYPALRIVACHMGAPWVFDACEVAAKNPNVYIDISGILVGSAEFISTQAANPLLLDRYRQALVFLNNYEKVLYGTDWPLVPMGAYIEFCKKLIPAESHTKVFCENAVKVYKLDRTA
jgi:predicted TIM-barrel fold metal-dependent hydrolase